MASTVPAELWQGILRKISDPCDLARLEQVSISMQAIVTRFCWDSYKKLYLHIDDSKLEAMIKFDQMESLLLTFPSSKDLLETIQSITKRLKGLKCLKLCFVTAPEGYLHDNGIFQLPAIVPQILSEVGHPANKIECLDLNGHFTDRDLAWCLRTFAKTLTHFRLFCSEELPVPIQTMQTLWSCLKLRSFDIGGRIYLNLKEPFHSDLLSSALASKTELKSLKLSTADKFSGSELAIAILCTNAKLQTLHLHQSHPTDEFLQCYQKMLSRYENLMENHPLRTVQQISMREPENVKLLLDICPNLEQLKRSRVFLGSKRSFLLESGP